VSQPDFLLMLDAIARRYGCFPHEVLDLDPFELGLAIESYKQADATASAQIKRISNKGGWVFPVVALR
jgi:hypothetical protein